MRGSRKLKKAAESYWIHPDFHKKLKDAAWNEIGTWKHTQLGEDNPWQNHWAYCASIDFAETVLRLLGEKTDEDMED